MKWKKYYFYTHKCGTLFIRKYKQELFQFRKEVCIDCGEDLVHYEVRKSDPYVFNGDIVDQVRRWNQSKVKWYNPFSWNSAYWEYKN